MEALAPILVAIVLVAPLVVKSTQIERAQQEASAIRERRRRQ